MRYRALVGLSFPEDAAELARIKAAHEAGAPIPSEERRLMRVEMGEVCDPPTESLGWLLKQELVEEYDGRHPKASKGRFIWAAGSEVYHDRKRLTENCNTDDIAEPGYGNQPPDGRVLCAYCEGNEVVA